MDFDDFLLFNEFEDKREEQKRNNRGYDSDDNHDKYSLHGQSNRRRWQYDYDDDNKDKEED